MDNNYDLVIIGAGPGGYVSAIRAAQYGLSVGLIEKCEVGGTCLNRGCVPTKALIHTSHIYREMANCERLGISANELSFDMEKIYARKDDVVSQLRNGIEFLIKSYKGKIDIISGRAKITSADTLEVTSDSEKIELKAKNILIAAGSVPARPPIPGLDLPGVITSDDILNNTGKAYKKLTIIGGGVIGVEFATIFNALGCDVTIIEAADRILPIMDREISQNLNMIMKKRGVSIYSSAKVEKIEKDGDILKCNFNQKDKELSVESEAVLVAIGRRANLEGLFSEGFSVECKRGIVVDDNFQTSVPGIYAIGDVIDSGIQLAHVASAQGCNAVTVMAGKKPSIDLSVVPSCIYTDPEIASVGINTDQAKAMGIDIKTGKFNMSSLGRSLIETEERGFTKLVFDANTDVLLGAQLMCQRATDLIGELSTAIVNKLTIHQLASVIKPHPSFTEGIFEAVESAEDMAVHIVKR
ncbi:MAG: dihydrolipoyl dehydrogenase [Clostridiales bacterium]|jgi:dihydrolipoamide dehydrogenase|nr:dihydrolipoyl dehydrogenase [Clostridiales bacterium]